MSCAIAIDGPAGAGKSTIARILAKELEFIYVDTGALYRAIGYHVLGLGLETADTEGVIDALQDLTVAIDYVEGEQHVFVNGKDVSGSIRTPEVSMAASAVSAIPEVRAFLLDVQRGMAATRSVVMDGRDIGTTILPDARIKIFLTASPEARARRRHKELLEKGTAVTYDEVLADMVKRDYDDTHRAASPLRRAADAVLVDTSEDTLEQAVARMKAIVLERL
ncbi:MAG: (d)CMP kinase [Ruminococcaceae bacterium]|nr:(d)CMP kinase [Oscillospiraceae bacterium]